VFAKDSNAYHVRVNLWLALYKLIGWLASLDLRRHPNPTHPLPPKLLFPYALYDVLVLDGVRIGLFWWRYRWRRELSTNLAILNKVNLHTNTYMRTCTKSAFLYKQGPHNKGHARPGKYYISDVLTVPQTPL